MLSSSPSVMDMVPSLLPERNKSVAHVSKNIRFQTSWACVWPKCTFKGVENGALADGRVYVVKLVIKLCVQVACLVRCYTTENKGKGISSLSSHAFTHHVIHYIMLYINLQQKQILLTHVEHYCWWHWQIPLLQPLLTTMSRTKQEVKLHWYTLSVFNHTI